MPFYGNVISDQGLKPDPKKVDVIVKMPAPKDKTATCIISWNVSIPQSVYSKTL